MNEPACGTVVGLIVSDGDDVLREAVRYVSHMPPFGQVYLHAPYAARRELGRIARERNVPMVAVEKARQATAMSSLCVIIGECPFDEQSIAILLEQGIPVEHQPLLRRGRGAKRRRGAGT